MIKHKWKTYYGHQTYKGHITHQTCRGEPDPLDPTGPQETPVPPWPKDSSETQDLSEPQDSLALKLHSVNLC